MQKKCTHDETHICADCVGNIPDKDAAMIVLITLFAVPFLVVGLLAYGAYSYFTDEEELGARATKQVVKEIKTTGTPTYEYEFVHNETKETYIQQVSQAEYETWLQGSMTTPGYPVPTLDGYTWVKAVGGKENVTVTEPILKTGEYIILQEESATSSALYKTVDGITTSI